MEDIDEKVEKHEERVTLKTSSVVYTGLKNKNQEEWQKIKERHIIAALEADPVDLETLRREAVCRGGLLNTELRRKVWPKLVGVNQFRIKKYTGPPLNSHKETAQVQLDVNRCGRRMPPELSTEQRKVVQEQLSRIILRLLVEQRGICYYQGLHEVVLSLLLVLGEDLTYAVMKKLTQFHLRDFLDADMGKTKEVIAYISPLLFLVDQELEEFITRSDCAYYFSLSWLITWYSHVVDTQEHAARLTDLFLASHPMMPVYLATAIIADRRDDVLAQECEMSSVHGLFTHLPSDLDYEAVIATATQYFQQYPLNVLATSTRIKLNSSYMNYYHSSFLRHTRTQRPDHILATLPEDPDWLSWAFMYRLFTSKYTASVVVGMISIAAYYWWHRQPARPVNYRD